MDLWQPFKASILEWAPNRAIVHDNFHIMRHANRAVDERWLLLTRPVHLSANKLKNWTLQLRWQRLPARGKLGHMPMDRVDGILNYRRVKVRFGVVEAIHGNIKSIPRRGRGYKNPRYLLLQAQRMAATKTEFVVLRKAS